jgi:repressor LexA
MIVLSEGRSRGIELPGGIPSAAASSLPLVGEVRAGEPILAVENIEEHIALDKNLFKDEGSFVLRVRGDSMRDAGILEGDYVVVSPSREVRTGQTGVALVGEEEATVKEIRYEGGDVVLVPHNPDYETTRHRAGTVRILGRVTGVVRKL